MASAETSEPWEGPGGAGLRNSAKALVVADGRLLCTVNADPGGTFYLLPGGGQRFGETLAEAVRREGREELGLEVEVGDLRLVREYLGAHHEFAVEDADTHQLEFMFECRVLGPAPEGSRREHDAWQTGVEWLPLDRLAEYRLYPRALATVLGPAGVDRAAPVYMGDIN